MQITDNEHGLLIAICHLPILLPNCIDFEIVMNDSHKKIYPFKFAKLNNKNNDLSQEWYIEFWAWSESENRLKRKRLTAINSLNTIEERNNYAHNVIRELNKLLEGGGHFDKLKFEKNKSLEETKKIVDHLTIIDYLYRALDLNKNKYNGRTYTDKKHDVKLFNEFIIKKNLKFLAFEDLEKKHCLDYQLFLLNNGYSGKTINCRMSTISTFFNEAIENDIVNKNPFEGIKRIKEVQTGINRALSDAEIEQIKAVLKDKFPELWCVCMMMFYCFL